MINLANTTKGIYFELSKSATCLTKQFKGVVYEAADCSDVCQIGFNENGFYEVTISGKKVRLLCDMTTFPFGCTVFQKRFDGSVDFHRNWSEYQYGFGRLQSEFWIGNENLHLLTTGKSNLLRIEMKRFNSVTYNATYKGFHIGTMQENYKLSLDNDGDNALLHQNQQLFTTYDKDNDQHAGNCAEKHGGGWWYNKCFWCNLNGKYYSSAEVLGDTDGIIWNGDQGYSTGNSISLKETEMKFRKNV